MRKVKGPQHPRGWPWAVAAVVVVAVVAAGGYALYSRGGSSTDDTYSLDPQVVALGQSIYQSNCAVCHGFQGEGQPNWRTQNPDDTYPAPPHDSTGHTWHHGDGLLFEVVSRGGQIYASPGFRSAMPPFGEQLEAQEIRAVLTYLKSFWGPQERSAQAEQSLRDPFP
ncbi:MAG: cytochrome c [Chloroflexi bacterium]|nr:cytochrome c [Chloroflexota bacterium]